MRDDTAQGPVPGAVVQDGAIAGTAAPRLLLDIVRRLRGWEHGYLAGLLHDGPIQELAAAALELGEARHAMGVSQCDELGVIAQQVDAASRSLRSMQDELWPFPQPAPGLAAALQRRTAWLLATPLTVDAGEGAATLLASEIPVVADIIELIMVGLAGAEAPARTLAAVRADQDVIFLELNMSSAADSDQAFGGPAAARAWLHNLAVAIQAGANIDVHGRRLRIRMEIPRQPRHQEGMPYQRGGQGRPSVSAKAAD